MTITHTSLYRSYSDKINGMESFIQQINLINQKFRCFECEDHSETLNLTIDIHNELNDGANETEIWKLQQLIPSDSIDVIDLYKYHNGIKLFCNKGVSGFQIYPISDLQGLNEEWKESFSYYEEDELYNFQKGGFAFGDISNSGNYFILYQNKVFYSNHDGGDDEPLSDSFNEFLSMIINNPADFLNEMGCYTRYSDGKTDNQWIPKEFYIDEN